MANRPLGAFFFSDWIERGATIESTPVFNAYVTEFAFSFAFSLGFLRHSMKPFLWMLLGLAVLTMVVITAYTVTAPKGPRYTIAMANRTHRQLNDVAVYCGDQMAAVSGSRGKGTYATYSIVTLPVPDEVTVAWTEENGSRHAPKVKLSGIVPSSPRDMTIWFIIEESGAVTVEYIRDDDLDANSAIGKTLVEVRNKPGTIDDLLVGAKPVAGAAEQFVKPGGVGMAQSQFDALVGNLPVTKHPDGSQSATLQDGTAVTVHARKPDGGFDMYDTGIIRAALPTGKEIQISYPCPDEFLKNRPANKGSR